MIGGPYQTAQEIPVAMHSHPSNHPVDIAQLISMLISEIRTTLNWKIDTLQEKIEHKNEENNALRNENKILKEKLAAGDLSRNRSVGLKLGEGKTLKAILAEMDMVAEGVKTTKSAYDLAREMKVEMPILEQVYAVLYQGKTCSDAVQDLMSRDQKEEMILPA